ncbi:MAG: hypothetical protein C4B58_07620 [Deltaproteobacteria bacterium]|nr:MAG: hypothetical protein C4B58_07620 [Deltaproteobacteria bacterium]
MGSFSFPAILSPSRLALHGYPDRPNQIMSDAAHERKHRGKAIERPPFHSTLAIFNSWLLG